MDSTLKCLVSVHSGDNNISNNNDSIRIFFLQKVKEGGKQVRSV